MRIMLVIYSLARGGAERVLCTMANDWAERGHNVTVVTIGTQDTDAYRLAPEVRREALGFSTGSRNIFRVVWSNLRRLYDLRAVTKRLRPEVVVSFTANINVLAILALSGTHIPVIVAERADPSQVQLGYLRNKLRNLLYPHAATVVVQTQRVLRAAEQRWPRAQLAAIPNPVPEADPDAHCEGGALRGLVGIGVEAKVIAAMGRLGHEKGFDLLIEAFGRLHTRYPGWHLVVFGKGPAQEQLQQQIAERGLHGRVHLAGQVQAARMHLSQADIFVLSSRFEGFPNVLLEAMAGGRPVISFDCPSGPGEIIRDGYDGVLVKAGDVSGLESAMAALMDDPARRAELGRNAREVLQRYSLNQVMQLWDKTMVAACSDHS